MCGLGLVLGQTAELGGSYLSHSRLPQTVPSLPPHLLDMERPGFVYMALFSDHTRYNVSLLINCFKCFVFDMLLWHVWDSVLAFGFPHCIP